MEVEERCGPKREPAEPAVRQGVERAERLDGLEIGGPDPGHRLRRVGGQPDRLELEVLLEPGDAVLPADPALLVPAEG